MTGKRTATSVASQEGAAPGPMVANSIPLSAIKVKRPFPWRHLLDYLGHRLTPGAEHVDPAHGGSYVRKVGHMAGNRPGDTSASIRLHYDARRACLLLDFPGGSVDATAQAGLQARATALFDAGFDAGPMEAVLGRSSLLRTRLNEVRGLRPPSAWEPFELCVRTVAGQQVSVAAAATLLRRLTERCGPALTPHSLLDANLDAIGMPSRRVACLQGLARAIVDDQLDLHADPWSEVNEALKQLPGFGPWTRSYLAIRLGRDTDAFPETDIGLLRAAGAASPAELLRMAERWRPWRAHAALYLWAVTPRR